MCVLIMNVGSCRVQTVLFVDVVHLTYSVVYNLQCLLIL